MTTRRTSRGRGLVMTGLGALVASSVTVLAAETSVEASYAATLAGFPVGNGTLTFGVGDDGSYRASLDARIAGLASVIANRTATAAASGRASGTDVVSRGYRLAIDGGPMPNHVDMDFAGGAVTQVSATELRFPGWDRRIPLKPEHKRGVVDPLAAFVIAVPPGKDAMNPTNCNHTAKVFDGRVRYDLRMVYGSRMEVQGREGYTGPALVCAVGYKPIAGFRPLSPEEEKFERNLEFSIWFVPAGGSNVMIPYKVVVGTPVGLLQVYAHRFDVRGTRAADTPTEPATTSSIRKKRRAALDTAAAEQAQ
mgnify:CR=1 FL=1